MYTYIYIYIICIYIYIYTDIRRYKYIQIFDDIWIFVHIVGNKDPGQFFDHFGLNADGWI